MYSFVRKTLLVLSVVIMLMAFVACGKKEDVTPSDVTNSSSSTDGSVVIDDAASMTESEFEELESNFVNSVEVEISFESSSDDSSSALTSSTPSSNQQSSSDTSADNTSSKNYGDKDYTGYY